MISNMYNLMDNFSFFAVTLKFAVVSCITKVSENTVCR